MKCKMNSVILYRISEFEFIEDILNAYTLGMSEIEIVDTFGISHEAVIQILDIYTQYL